MLFLLADNECAKPWVARKAQCLVFDRFKLSREFRQELDMTMGNFLFKEKMTRAAFLLSTYRDINFEKVAEKFGFCTCDYFIRKFRQHYGIVPGKYREYKTPRFGIEDQRSGLKVRKTGYGKSLKNIEPSIIFLLTSNPIISYNRSEIKNDF